MWIDYIAHVPHWVHHRDLDDIIPLQASQRMVTAVRDVRDKDVAFTRYSAFMHYSWTAMYNNPEAYQWMLQHRMCVIGEEEAVSVKIKSFLFQEQS